MHSVRLQVVPGVRRWASAARIGRHPIEPVACDLLDPEQIHAALAGVDFVIHCAVGDTAATVDGTRNLLSAAHAAGIRRLIHVSTIDVYGTPSGTVTEDHPLVRTGRPYGDSKIEAEEACREFEGMGLGVVILRPTIVYGPHSDLWVSAYARRFFEGSWLLSRDACQGRCNLLYVDDLVQACILSLEAEGVEGLAFNVNGPDVVSWQAYFDRLNHAFGYPPLPQPNRLRSRGAAAVTDPVKRLAKATMARFDEPIMQLYKRSKAARSLMKGVEAVLRRAPSTMEFDLYSRSATYPTDRAEERLGFRPSVTADEGIGFSADWALHEGIAKRRGS